MRKLYFILFVFLVEFGYCQNVFQDNLNTYTTGIQLSGQGTWTNNSSNGGFGACTGAICTNAQLLNQSFSYVNYGSSLHSLQLLSDTDGCGSLFTPITSGDMYLGLMINIASSSTNPNDFFRVCNGGAFTTTFRVFIKTVTANSFQIGISKGASGNAVVYTASSYGFNQDHLLILKYSQLSGANDDVLNLYVNPTIINGVPAMADATTNSGSDQSGNVDRFGFRQNATATPTGRAGLPSIAKSWTGLIFPTLSNSTFNNYQFEISSNTAKSGNLLIKSNSILSNASLNIYDESGKVLESKKINLENQINEIPIKAFQNDGFYIVEIISENNSTFSQKIIVK